MCYLQPPAAVPLSLSLHRWQLNPTAACHSEARKKWWCCCLKRVWEERKTDPEAPMWMSVFWHHKCFSVWQGFGTAAGQMLSQSVLSLTIYKLLLVVNGFKFNQQFSAQVWSLTCECGNHIGTVYLNLSNRKKSFSVIKIKNTTSLSSPLSLFAT